MRTLVSNEFWKLVEPHAKPEPIFGGLTVDLLAGWRDEAGNLSYNQPNKVDRFELASRYSWTITDPATVDFIVEHAAPRVIDPLAGSGWWAKLLTERGLDVLASDLEPGASKWHSHGVVTPVLTLDAREAVAAHGRDRTLLLSWPPYVDDLGANVVAAYGGNRIIYIGEGEGGCCGDDAMFAAFDTCWVEVAGIRPVQWFGMHDYVTVYERKGADGE